MSISAKRSPTPADFVIQNTKGKGSKQTTVGPMPDEKLHKFCDKPYNQLLPPMAEKVKRRKMSSRGCGKGKETYSHASDVKVHLDTSMRVPEETQVLEELTEAQTAEKEKKETLFKAMSHALARDKGK
ncbi:hypothetical protein Tco_0874631 [Tanacetum coccineum]|uniref:Uncharacterized protein n=1 Tax=Tanacetum coccineum TaxID=301880 RepID=A0ABQ5BM51_9ASTR